MARLSERERIEILMMLGYGDRRRSLQDVCNLFNNTHPNRDPISKSVVGKNKKKIKKKIIKKNKIKKIQKHCCKEKKTLYRMVE